MNSWTRYESVVKGRGAQHNTRNPFQLSAYDIVEPKAIDSWETEKKIPTQYFEAQSKTILNKVQSEDIPVSYSLNPYQGCEHGCVYCYARNTHEYWGFSAGIDFESKIIYKKRAPELLREMFSQKKWRPTPISISGNTDCYQPIERSLQITRKLLQVCLDYKNPVGIITKNALVLRDLDILQELAKNNLVVVYSSITSMDENLRRKLEPRTSTYASRIQTIEKLSNAGIRTGVMNAPIIPGLNDTHMFDVLRCAANAGAKAAGYSIVRLNGPVEPIFDHWLKLNFPLKYQKIMHGIADCHGGQVHNYRSGIRMKGEGPVASIIAQQFAQYCKQFGLNNHEFSFNTESFERLQPGQLRLF